MQEFWNQRFAESDYAYGHEPNKFLKTVLPDIPKGHILFPAEGEGRNAVFAASLEWKVTAYDYSAIGRQKALQLANQKNVYIQYDLTSHQEAQYPDNSFDAIGLFYAHTLDNNLLLKKILDWLKPNGTILIEGFSQEQIMYHSGGPKDISMLFSVEDMKNIYVSCSLSKIWQEVIQLNEGKYHQGKASVIRAIIIK